MTVRIHRVEANELAQLHAIRLDALAESPDAFGSTYEVEAALDPTSRLRWVTEGVAVIGEDGATWLGLATGTVVDNVVNVFAMWVRPERRREGIAQSLLDEVLSWGKEQGAESARLGVVDDNFGALAFYESNGFAVTGEREPLRSDDTHEVVYLVQRLT